jgi:hypothetical protein
MEARFNTATFSQGFIFLGSVDRTFTFVYTSLMLSLIYYVGGIRKIFEIQFTDTP